MARSSNAIPWALVALLSGGLLYRPNAESGRSTAEDRASLATADQVAGARKSAAASTSDKGNSEDLHRDALDVLGEHYGVDVSDEGLQLLARQSAQVLLYETYTTADQRDQAQALLEALKPPSGSLPLPETTRSRVAELLAQKIERPSDDAWSLLHSREDAVEQARTFLSNYFWRDRDELRLRLLMARVGRLDVRTVIATLPDPIDSNVRWLFDPMMDAIQRAATDSSYVLDRFYIPDWNPERAQDHSSEPTGAHERWPAVVLFRRNQSAGGMSKLLMVFLVSETATTGVHQVALDRALSYAALVQRESVLASRELAILGPSFSGSADSMLKSLQRFGAERPQLSFRITTGGATGEGIRATFENDQVLGGRITFRSTVLPDDLLLEGLAKHLLLLDPQLSDRPGKIAILQEANTAYGSTIVNAAATSRLRTPGARLIFDQAIRLPFPMHISRVRGDALAARQREQPQNVPTPQRFRTLTLDEPGTPTDQIPSFSPQMTAASVELMLANIIDTIKRERVRVVGLVATDARDKLFLAEQISEFAPGVLLFTLESDLMFVHPDYNKYVRGMIVASSYPLFAQNQTWTSRSDERRRQQFATTNSEGVYNALLALVDYDLNGTPRGNAPPPLLDYRPPAPMKCFILPTPPPIEQYGCVPPVWISVVAADALWPIGVTFPFDVPEATLERSDPAVLLAPWPAEVVQLADLGDPPDVVIVRPSWTMGFALLMFSALALSATALFMKWRRLKSTPDQLKALHRAADAIRYQRVALTTITVLGVPVAFVCYVALAITWHSRLLLDHSLYGLVIVAEVAVLAATIAAYRTPEEHRPRIGGVPVAVSLLRFLTFAGALVIAIAGAWRLAQHLWQMAIGPSEVVRHTRFAQRALQLDSGVSPLVPVALLAAPILGWSLLQLWRVGGARLEPVMQSRWVGTLASHLDSDWRGRLGRAWGSPTRGLPTSYLGIILSGLIVTVVLSMHVHPVTIEPVAFSEFLAAAWLLGQLVIALTLAHSIYLWVLNRRLLRAIAASTFADAFARLPREGLLHGRFSPAPERADLVRPARFYRALAELFPKTSSSAIDPAVVRDLQTDFAKPLETELSALEYVPWSNTSAFTNLMQRGDAVYRAITVHRKPAASTFLSRERDVETSDEAERWMLRAEEFLAMLLTLVIRQLVSRVVRGLGFVTIALVLVIVALTSFPIYPREPLIGYAWVWALLAASAGVWVSVTMERDVILSRLTGTAPNRVTWNLAFVTKLVVYVGVPILTLFAAQFPQFGGMLLRWMTPLQPLP